MSAILGQLAVAIGFLMFLVVLGMSYVREVPIMMAIFRGLVVMFITSTIMVVFFKFFTVMLRRYVAEQALSHSRRKQEGSEAETEPAAAVAGTETERS